jgi:hypothetical protein
MNRIRGRGWKEGREINMKTGKEAVGVMSVISDSNIPSGIVIKRGPVFRWSMETPSHFTDTDPEVHSVPWRTNEVYPQHDRATIVIQAFVRQTSTVGYTQVIDRLYVP